MFLVQAIADFEPEMVLGSQQDNQAQQPNTKDPVDKVSNQLQTQKDQTEHQRENQKIEQSRQAEEPKGDEKEGQQVQQDQEGQDESEQKPNAQDTDKIEPGKRPRSQQHQKQFQQAQNQPQQITYLTFKKGDKIVTRQTYDNGWWFGNVLKKPDIQGYFPSNFVKVGTTAPLPEAPPDNPKQKDWLQQQLTKMNGPVKSEYYQGITGYKMVKIDDKNKNILKGNYVKYDVASGLAKVPIKSQDPTAKAVRQMGYYFDYHQWCEQKNANPTPPSRPDPRKKRKKRLNLILFGEDKIKHTKKQ